MTGELFRVVALPDTGLALAIEKDLALMAMEITECPILVRQDPEGDWCTIIQGPPGEIHVHMFEEFAEALACADEHAALWRAVQEREPVRLRDLLTEVMKLMRKEGD